MSVWHSVICEERKPVNPYAWLVGLPTPLAIRAAQALIDASQGAIVELTQEEMERLCPMSQ